jgi:hypothetical protein
MFEKKSEKTFPPKMVESKKNGTIKKCNSTSFPKNGHVDMKSLVPKRYKRQIQNF